MSSAEMMDIARDHEAAYAQQLDAYAEELARGRIDQVRPGLAPGSSDDDVWRYIENAVGERMRMLKEDTGLAALAFDDFDALILEYLSKVPRPTYCCGRREASAFLQWLSARRLDARQADFVAFQRAEFACLELAHDRQRSLQRFRAAIVAPAQAAARLEVDAHARFGLNPARVWTHLSGYSLGRGDAEKTPVLFAPFGEEICQHVFSEWQRGCLTGLEALSVPSLARWRDACTLSCDEALTLVHDWIEKEIVVVV